MNETTLEAGRGVCWWESFQNNHGNLAGRGSWHRSLGLLVRNWGDIPLTNPSVSLASQAQHCVVWGLVLSGVTGLGTFVQSIIGPEGHTARQEPVAGEGQDGRHCCVLRKAQKSQEVRG